MENQEKAATNLLPASFQWSDLYAACGTYTYEYEFDGDVIKKNLVDFRPQFSDPPKSPEELRERFG